MKLTKYTHNPIAEIERAFDGFFNLTPVFHQLEEVYKTGDQVRFSQDENALSVQIDLPGVNKEDLDLLYYQGGTIDISPLIREQIILSVPSYPLCQESCKGICSQCGSNLNQDLCHCDKEGVTNSKFEILKHFTVKR